MWGDWQAFLRGDRGVSEVIGYSIIVGFALLGGVLVVVAGGGLVEEVTDQTERESAKLVLQEMDSKLTTLSHAESASVVEFDLDTAAPGDLKTTRDARINITVNRNASATGPDCQTEVALSTVEYEASDEDTIAYEGGGLWRGDRRNGSSMITPPELTYRGGSLSITGVSIDGGVGESINEAVLDRNTSREESRRKEQAVLSGDCLRPDNITIKVRSEFFRGWENYLESELGESAARVTSFEENGTALAYIPQEGLPRATDDTQNRVVNLSGASYMSVATVEDNPSGNVPPYINISKENRSAASDYRVVVRPIVNGTSQIGNNKTLSKVSEREGPERTFVFVFDSSGSMNDNTGQGTKIEVARDSAQQAIGILENSALIGIADFDSWGRHPSKTNANHAFLTRNQDKANQTLDDISAGGDTCLSCGIDLGLQTFNTQGNQFRERKMVLLSDGKDNRDIEGSQDPEDAARKAIRRNITVDALGFGKEDDLNTDLLESIANKTGGIYEQTTDPDEVRDFFERSARRNVVTRDQIRLTPVTTNATVGGGTDGVAPPFFTGDRGAVDRVTAAGAEFPNVNDPIATTDFRHEFGVADGQRVYLSASQYGCDEWRELPATLGNSRITRCADVDGSNVTNVSASSTSIYLDGDPAPPSGLNASWQDPIEDRLAPVLDGGEFDLASNQAVVIYDVGSGDGDTRFPVLYEVGLADDQVQPEDVIDIRVRNVTVR